MQRSLCDLLSVARVKKCKRLRKRREYNSNILLLFNSYFADTLANQEASRHNEPTVVPGTVSCEMAVDSPDLVSAYKSVTSAGRLNSSASYNNPQSGRSRINETVRASQKQYNTRIGTSLSCGSYHIT